MFKSVTTPTGYSDHPHTVTRLRLVPPFICRELQLFIFCLRSQIFYWVVWIIWHQKV